MNKEVMLRLADRLENCHDNFHMGSWFGKVVDPRDIFHDLENEDEVYNELLVAPSNDSRIEDFVDVDNQYTMKCGTTACIAGWACVDLFATNTEKFHKMQDSFSSRPGHFAIFSIYNIAREHLDLTTSEAEKLFYCHSDSVWDRYSEEYNLKFKTDVESTWYVHPKIAADVLRRIVNEEIKLDGDYNND